MGTIMQEFKSINYRIKHSKDRLALNNCESVLRRIKSDYENDPSPKIRKTVRSKYRANMKLIRHIRKRVK